MYGSNHLSLVCSPEQWTVSMNSRLLIPRTKSANSLGKDVAFFSVNYVQRWYRNCDIERGVIFTVSYKTDTYRARKGAVGILLPSHDCVHVYMYIYRVIDLSRAMILTCTKPSFQVLDLVYCTNPATLILMIYWCLALPAWSRPDLVMYVYDVGSRPREVVWWAGTCQGDGILEAALYSDIQLASRQCTSVEGQCQRTSLPYTPQCWPQLIHSSQGSPQVSGDITWCFRLFNV